MVCVQLSTAILAFLTLHCLALEIPSHLKGSNTTNPALYFISSDTQVAAVGSYVRMRVIVRGNPMPSPSNIRWSRAGGGALAVASDDKESMQLKDLKASHAGGYRVYVRTSAGMRVVECDIETRPKRMSVDVIPKKSELLQGTIATIQCSAGEIQSKYVWLRDGVPVDTDPRFSTYNTVDKSSLTIRIVNLEDAGTYECRSWNSNSAGNNTASITVKPADKIPTVYITESRTEYAKASFNIVMGCHVPDDPQATFSYWEKSGKEIPSDSRRYYESSRKKLNIIDIRVSDTGDYTCVGILSNGIVVQNTTTLTVKPAITVTCTEDQFLDIGVNAVIECSVYGDTQPTEFMAWMKGTQTIQDSSKYILNQGQSRLEIRDLQTDDGGTYSVLVKTSLGTLHQASSVTVIVMSSITKSPASVTVSTGSAVSFTCVASGTPLPFVFWNKDDKKIDADETQITIETNKKESTQQESVLTIKRATKFDEGSYVCFAYNVKISVTSETALLNVIDPPSIDIVPTNVSVAEGRAATLFCGFTGDQPITVSWQYKDKPVDITQRIQSGVSIAGGELIFNPTKNWDSGAYTCIVKNKVGSEQATASLTVQVPPSITLAPLSYNVTMNSAVILSCESTTGFPPPTISWRKNGNLIIPKGGKFTAGSTLYDRSAARDVLEIEKVTETATYTCTASNGAGTDTKEAKVAMKTVPEKPGLPIAGERDKNSILLHWEPGHDGYSPIHQYTVMYKMGEEGEWKTYPTAAMTNELRVTDLQPYKKYIFRVFSTNEIGMSEASNEARISTEQGVPSAPLNLAVTPLSSTSAKITWDIPKDTQGFLFSYDLDYQIRGSLEEKEETIHTQVTEYTLKNLEKYTEYSIRVQGKNGKGLGNSSPMVFFRTLEDTPGPPKYLKAAAISSTSVRVTWTPPTSSNGKLLHYKLYYACTSDCEVQSTVVDKLNENPTWVLQDLFKYTEYRLYVTAVTGAGEGSTSSNSVVQTLEDAPDGPPQGVAGQTVSSTSIMVSWAPPVKRNQCGLITKYRILYKSVNSPTSQPLEIPNVSQYLLINLEKYTAYSIQIQAGTERGFGPGSDPIIITTDEDVPSGAPVEIQTNAKSSTSINVVWSSPPEAYVHGEITRYTVYYGPSETEKMMSFNVAPTTLNAYLKDLQINKKYMIYVTLSNSKGEGPRSTTVEQLTSPDLPGGPQIIEIDQKKRKVILKWKPPVEPNGEIISYRVRWKQRAESIDWKRSLKQELGPKARSFEVTGLEPYTHYLMGIVASTKIGYGNMTIQEAKTEEDKPEGMFEYFKGHPLNTSTIELTWRDPVKANGVITSYTFQYRSNTADIKEFTAPASQIKTVKQTGEFGENEFFKHDFTGLVENTVYEVRGAASNALGQSDFSEWKKVKTTFGAPANLLTSLLSPSSLLVSWDKPQGLEAEDITYKVAVESTKDAAYNQVRALADSKKWAIFKSLKKNCTYKITVKAVVGSQEGPWSDNVSVLVEYTASPVPTPAPDVSTPGKIVIRPKEMIPASFLKPGVMFSVLLTKVMSNEVEPRVVKRSEYDTPRVVYSAEVTQLPESYEISDLGTGGGTYVLQTRLSLYGVTIDSEPTPEFNVTPKETVGKIEGGGKPLPKLLYLFVIIPIGLLLIVVLVVCLVRRQRMRKYNILNKTDQSEPMLGQTTLPLVPRSEPYYTSDRHPPIPISALPAEVERLHANDDDGFYKEFERIEICSMYTFDSANLDQNRVKNRYHDIVPYDYNRVKIEGYGPGGDYINASYCDGYMKKNAYIATQGPIPETFASFWKMVWEQRTATIVMVTKLLEEQRIKCHQYWPTLNTSQRYGEVSVIAQDEVLLPDYTVRKFALQCATGNNQMDYREVIQFQFTAWPDHGVPTYATATLSFLRRVQATNPEDAGPMVIHCSAGVGRTGTFMVVDTMLQRINKERDVDVFGCVSMLRTQRMSMVQTQEQYIFIHNALLEAIHCGNTEMRPRDLPARLDNLNEVDSENNTCGMEIEFKRLTIQYKYSPNLFTSANLPVNHCKNRFANVLPFESTRVILQTIPGREGSDYINASYINGYQKRNAFIATQGPLEETVQDFWRMLWEQNVNTVVMLTQLVECSRTKCHAYWHNDKPLKLPLFTINHRLTNETQSFTLRELSVTNTQTGEERVVRQFHFDTWPEQGLPQSSALLGLIYRVQTNNQRLHESSPILVHCSAGGGRTGVFIAIATAVERHQNEKLIDIFNNVKNLRNARPAMVQTLDQYRFIYQVMSEYLESQADGYLYC